MYGKVLRLNPDGTHPPTTRSSTTMALTTRHICLRFPQPVPVDVYADGKLLVADVGQDTWEEVNLVTAGGNYGWPNAEGPCNGIGTTSCSTPSSYDNPIYAYQHDDGGGSITAVMVYTGATSRH